MRTVLGVAGVTLREAWKGGLIALVPLYTAFLAWVLLAYPAIDDEARFRQALSLGHGALLIGVGLVCLLLGVTGVAADREGGRAARCATAPGGRGGYVVGRISGLAAIALLLSLSLGATEAVALRWAFSDRPELFEVRPLLDLSSFRIEPEEAVTGGEAMIYKDRRGIWTYPAEEADRACLGTLRPGFSTAGTSTVPIRIVLRRGTVEEMMEVPLSEAGRASVFISDRIRASRGDLEIEVTCLDSTSALAFDLRVGPDGAPREGLILSAAPAALERNLLLAAIGVGCLGILLGAAGIAAALLFSAPVALFAVIGLYILGLGSGLFEEFSEPTSWKDPVAEVFGVERSPSPALIRAGAVASMVIPDLARFDMKAHLISSHGIRTGRVAGLFLYAAAVSALLAGVGWVAFRWRDLA